MITLTIDPTTGSVTITAEGGIFDGPVDFREAVTLEKSVYVVDLPTSDPISQGQLWSDGGTVKVSAG